MKIINNLQTQINYKSKDIHPLDLEYKKKIQAGLKKTFQLNCKIEDLESIVAPYELKKIIKNLQPKHYEIGEHYRANFHIHTDASDGNLTAESFLEQCKNWADKIFYKLKSKNNIDDKLPPFCAAITDHDRIYNVKRAIAIISQSPEKFKNFKFVPGCEFLFHGYKEPHPAFEAVGLSFNPFDENLTPLMQGFSSNNGIEDVKKVITAGGILSWAHPIITPDKINENFFQFLKNNNINGIEGYYQYIFADKEYVDKGKKILEPLIKKFSMFCTGGTDTHGKSIFKR